MMEITNTSIIMRRLDNFHAHLRTGPILADVLPFSNVFGRVVVMGNLIVDGVPRPVITAEDAIRYQNEILAAKPNFQPIMTIMLVNQTTPDIVRQAYQAGVRVLKLIPGGTSTGSDQGVRLESLENYYNVLQIAEELGMTFSVHCELDKYPDTKKEIPELNREFLAMHYLVRIVKRFTSLPIIVEHISDRRMIEFVINAPDNVAATVTPQHLLYTIDMVLNDGEIINPHLYCKPILKTSEDVNALRGVIFSGNEKFFFGSDSAPHLISAKQLPNPAAGIFSEPVVLPLIVQLFETFGALNNLEKFLSENGAKFYGLALNEDTIKLAKKEWRVPKSYKNIVPLCAGEKLQWRIAN